MYPQPTFWGGPKLPFYPSVSYSPMFHFLVPWPTLLCPSQPSKPTSFFLPSTTSTNCLITCVVFNNCCIFLENPKGNKNVNCYPSTLCLTPIQPLRFLHKPRQKLRFFGNCWNITAATNCLHRRRYLCFATAVTSIFQCIFR